MIMGMGSVYRRLCLSEGLWETTVGTYQMLDWFLMGFLFISILKTELVLLPICGMQRSLPIVDLSSSSAKYSTENENREAFRTVGSSWLRKVSLVKLKYKVNYNFPEISKDNIVQTSSLLSPLGLKSKSLLFLPQAYFAATSTPISLSLSLPRTTLYSASQSPPSAPSSSLPYKPAVLSPLGA
jgi:hypothetical protein